MAENGTTSGEGEIDLARARLVRALAGVANGDAASLKTLYQHTSAKLYGVCLRILADPGEAEDVLQDVYLTVWRNAGRFDPERASPITWLATLARNRSIDRLRARGPRRVEPLEAAAEIRDGAPTPAERAESSEAARRLAGCLDELEPHVAAALRAAFFEGETYETLAERAGVPLGTMKSWIRRALIRLRGRLAQ